MHIILESLLRHGYLLLAAWVFLEQVGLPVPSFPILLAAGALSGMGRMSFATALFLGVLSTITADTIWYQLGRHKGSKVLEWLCRISLEPDSCVRRAEGLFEKQGARSLLFAKFLPGLNAVTMPLAGIFRMRRRKFLVFDLLGSLLWLGTYLSLGYLFSGEIERVAQHAAALGSWLVVLLVSALASYILYKFLARRKFLRDLRISRISVDELKQKLDAGESVSIVDLRHSLDFEADPETIPGAVHLDSTELTEKSELLPRDREIILYCT
jgi:membrane protein DedA with SNARE-associated domain